MAMKFEMLVPAVVVFLLSQGPLFASSSSSACVKMPNNVQEKSLQSLKDLYSGMNALNLYFQYFLQAPINGGSIEFITLMGSVTTLVEHERRLQALITLQASEDDIELIALRLLLGKLVNDTCDLYTEVYGKECSTLELEKLKLKIDAYHATQMTIAAVRSTLCTLTGTASGAEWNTWARTKFVCSLSDVELDVVNHILGIGTNAALNKELC